MTGMTVCLLTRIVKTGFLELSKQMSKYLIYYNWKGVVVYQNKK